MKIIEQAEYQGGKLDLNLYWKTVGTVKIKEVCKEANTSFNYFRRMAYLYKNCPPKMFDRIERAAKKVTPEVIPDYVACTKRLSPEEIKLMKINLRQQRLSEQIKELSSQQE